MLFPAYIRMTPKGLANIDKIECHVVIGKQANNHTVHNKAKNRVSIADK